MTEPRDGMLLRDARVPEVFLADPVGFGGSSDSGCRRGNLVYDGKFRMERAAPGPAPALVMPWLVEAHCHLDKCHTAPRIPDIGGDLAAAIAAQWEDKARWTEADIRRRAGRGLDELVAAGCRLVRSHVDWGRAGEVPTAWAVLGELAQERQDEVSLQRSALAGIALLATDADAIAAQVAATGGALGAYVLDHPERRAGIREAFAAAEHHGLALDFHVDEGLAEGLDGLEIIADVALETGFQGPVLAGHACSLMNLSCDRLARLLDKLAASGVAVASLPVTNLYLQGRQQGTPDRRGVTRIAEMAAAGVTVVVGSDNVADAFCPTGWHDPMAALSLAVLAAHLDPPLDRWLPLITTNAANALGRTPVMVDRATPDQLCLIRASSIGDAIAGRGGAPVSLTDAMEAT